MARFKVGDRVKYRGKLATVIAPYKSCFTDEKCWTLLFDRAGDFRLAHDGDMGPEYSGRCWYVRDDNPNVEPLTAAPDVPDGWTPASEPPSGSNPARNVEIMLEDGKRGYGFYSAFCSGWIVIDDGGRHNHIAAPGEVVAWREIQPEPEPVKSRWIFYAGCAGIDRVLTEADAIEYAEMFDAGTLVARVVYEVRPGTPEVIKVEEK